MVSFTILAGGFSTFIATYHFDADAGTLNLTQQNPTGENPSWITRHPENPRILYAVNENPVGALQSFSVDDAGALSLFDTISSDGDGPTYCSVLLTGEVTAMNYGSPNCTFAATNPLDNAQFLRIPSTISFPIQSGTSHPHMSLEYRDEVFVPDLGQDVIWRIGRTGVGNFAVHGWIAQDKGTGPRHIAILDNILFTVHETTSTLTAQNIPKGPNDPALPLLANVSTVPPHSFKGSFFAAEILISQCTLAFPDPLIYVSNRNLGPEYDPRGDTIAIFQFIPTPAGSPLENQPQGGILQLVAQVYTGLKQVRGMMLGNMDDGSDKYIVAGANTEGGVSIFERIDGGRNLKLVVNNQETQNRTSFVWI